MRSTERVYEQRWSAAASEFPATGPDALSWVDSVPLRVEPGGRAAAVRRRVWSDRACRWVNIAAALALLLVAMPLMLVIAALVKVTSPGPVIYRQPRVGIDRRQSRGSCPAGECRRASDQGGRLFTIYKFRTMSVDSDRAGQVWATPDDQRITPVGGFLRKYRMDELPQLLNVLQGDMNLVGPRPEQPRIFVDLRQKVEGYQKRQRVLPGITGWAQVNHRYDHDLEDVRTKVRYDLEYIERRSPREDLKIMLQTLPAVVMKRGGH